MKRLLLSTAAVLSLSLLAHAGAPIAEQVGLHQDHGQAQAAFIRRGKLKQRPSVGYRSVLKVETGSGESLPAAVTLSYTALDEGGVGIADQTLTTPLKGTVLSSTEMLLSANAASSDFKSSPGYAFLITRRAASGLAIGDPTEVKVSLIDGLSGEVEFKLDNGVGVLRVVDMVEYSGEKAVAGVDPSLVEIDFDFDSWDEDSIDSVDITLVDAFGGADAYEDAAVAELDGSTLKYRTDSLGEIGGSRYQVDISLLNDGGEVTESASLLNVADGADLAGSIGYLKVKDTTKGGDPAVRITARTGGDWEEMMAAQQGTGLSLNLSTPQGTVTTASAETTLDTVIMEARFSFEEDPFAYAELSGAYELELVVAATDADEVQLTEQPFAWQLDLAQVEEGTVYTYETPYEAEETAVAAHKWALTWDADSSELVLGFSMKRGIGDDFFGGEDVLDEIEWYPEITDGESPYDVGSEPTGTWVAAWGNAKFAKVKVEEAGQTYGVGIVAPDGDSIDVSATAGVNGFGKGTKKSTSRSTARAELQ